jgi:IS5 family transposase
MRNMRVYRSLQAKIGEIDISKIKLDENSKDDIQRALRGIQTLYNNKEAMEQVCAILTEKIAPEKDKNNGRTGMELWNILVLGIIRLVANIDYCRLRDYANSHREVRGFLGLSYLVDDEIFDLQTIKNNVGLLTKEILDEISQIVIKLGHTELTEKQRGSLKTKADSFVLKTKVEYPTDIGLLEDASTSAIRDITRMAEEANIQGWRQADFAITKTKKLRFLAQKSKKSHAKDDKEKHLEKIWKPHQKLLNFVAKKIKRVKETITEIKKNWEVPKESDRKNNTLFGTSSEKLTPVEVKKMRRKIEKVEYYITEAEKQIEQITSRVLNEETIPHSEKTFSVYKPYTEWINKGKIGIPVELGVRLCIIDDQYGFILNHEIMYNQTDDKIAVKILEDTIEMFPNINSVSFDRGFHSKENQESCKKLVDKLGMPKKGKLSKEAKKLENTDDFLDAREGHAGIESSINALQVHGCDFCPDYSKEKFESYVSMSILGRNILNLGDIVAAKNRKRRNRKKYTFAYTTLKNAA